VIPGVRIADFFRIQSPLTQSVGMAAHQSYASAGLLMALRAAHT
jgi:hypothetical protein